MQGRRSAKGWEDSVRAKLSSVAIPSGTAILPKLERAGAQNLIDYVEAIRSVDTEVQAEYTMCANGIAAFCGRGSPLTTVKGTGPEIQEGDLEAAEVFFRQRKVDQVVLELAPWISESSLGRLLQRGYRMMTTEDVVIRFQPFDAPAPSHQVVSVSRADWPTLQSSANGAAETKIWLLIARASAQVRNATRFGVKGSSGDRIACAQLFEVGDVALFANDATMESARGRGAQTATIQHRLRQAAVRGFSCAAAEVSPGSTSERNYLRCGFQIAYSRSHYARVIP